jgi:glyoxylase-like metal-dependent hydrolase (beta-lactamase superfamily II)
MGRWAAIGGLLGIALMAGCSSTDVAPTPAAQPAYEVYAVRYATLLGYPTHELVAGADTSRRSDLAMTVWLLKGPGDRRVLVDAGFYRDEFVLDAKPTDFHRSSEVLESLGVAAGSITDIIISHVHWDHLDGASLFPNARVWIQRAEYEYYVGPRGEALHADITRVDAFMLATLRTAGRVQLVDGDAKEIIPGIRVYTGGRHTYASQYAVVNTRAGDVAIASDNVYLYENMDRHAPIGTTFDAAANLRAQDRMVGLAGTRRLVIPGHDPEVFKRFPEVREGVVRID